MRERRRGFTLVEVMVALAIVALALPALLFALDQHIDGTAYLRDKALARMVANNRLTELRLLAAARGQPLSGSESGEEAMGGRDWHWWVDTSATEVPGFRRVEIAVGEEPDRREAALVSLVAFLADAGGGNAAE